MTRRIDDLAAHDETTIDRIAAMLVESFREHWPDAWPDLESARQEVRESLEEGRISRVAFEGDDPVGWIGGMNQYAFVWELHPLVVRLDRQRRGIGRALVADLEQQVRARGGLTIVLGSDDEHNLTSVSGIDLYPDPLAHLQHIQDRGGHPFVFYQQCGFVISGIVPDANGVGKPDILMAKRIAGNADLPASNDSHSSEH